METKTSNGAPKKEINSAKPRFRNQQLKREFREQLFQDSRVISESEAQSEHVKTIRPYLIFGCGTTAVSIVDGIKRSCRNRNGHSFALYRCFDTDQSARAGTILDENEFQFLNLQRARNAIENPDKHRKLNTRFELDHPDIVAMVEKFLADALEQASAVRLHGAHGFLAEAMYVRNVLQEVLRQINNLQAVLDRQLKVGNSTRIREDLKVYVISSVCGGSGSSIFLQLIALLKQLTSGMKVEIVPILVMPSAFEDTLKKMPEHWNRTKANGYAALREVDAFMAGHGTRHEIDLGADDQETLLLGAGFARQVLVAGNKNCKGKHLSKEVIVSTLVEYLSTIICEPVMADILEMFDANAATLNLTEDDKKSRYVSSIGASSVCLDTHRVSLFCAVSATRKLIQTQAIGESSSQGSAKAESWLIAPTKDIVSLKDSGLQETFRRVATVSFEAKSRSLFRLKNGTQVKRLNDAAFVLAAVSVRSQIAKEWIPKALEVISNTRSTLQKKLVDSLESELAVIIANGGLVAGVAFLQTLENRIDEIRSVATKKCDLFRKNIEPLNSSLTQQLERMNRKWFRGWTKSGLQQDQIIGSLKSQYEGEVDSIAGQACCDLFLQLVAECVTRREAIQKSISSSEEVLQDLLELQRANTAGNRSHTEKSQVEIDIGSRAMDHLLFQRFCPDMRTLVQRIAVEERSKWYQQICVKGPLFEMVKSEFEQFFLTNLSELSLPEIMCEVLENEEDAGDLRTKLMHVVQETQPAWGETDSKSNATVFADHLIIGIPDGPEGKWSIVEDEVRRAANGRVCVNSQYNAALQIVPVPGNKLTVIRVVQGAAWQYLPEVRNLELAYNKWYQDGGHTVHIFDRATVAKFPMLIPPKRLLEEEQAIAVGLAYGAIVRRGQQFYWNLRKAGQAFCVDLQSHWDTLNSEQSASLAQLEKVGKWTASSDSESLDESLKMGSSLPSLQTHLKENVARRKMVMELFALLREQSGDAAIAAELDNYVLKILEPSAKLNIATADVHALTSLMGRVVNTLR